MDAGAPAGQPAGMATLLVHVTCGPEQPSRSALALLVARAAVEEGHEVSLFFAAEAVQLLRPAVLDALVGLGTGSLRESFDAAVAGGARVYASKMSSAARGVSADDLTAASAEPASPARLVQLAFDSDRVLTY
jgi:predicted peroxiredoxin